MIVGIANEKRNRKWQLKLLENNLLILRII